MAAYRHSDEILHGIYRQLPNENFAGIKVVMLGVPYKRYRADALERAETATDSTNSKGGKRIELDQTRVFALTLEKLLRNARLRVGWHDPEVDTAEQLAKMLDHGDFVVLVKNDPSYDMKAIREKCREGYGSRLFDVTDHQFDPTLSTSVASPLSDKAKHPSLSVIFGDVSDHPGPGYTRFHAAQRYAFRAAIWQRDDRLDPDEQSELVERYSRQAVQSLVMAHDAGFFRSRENARLLMTDQYLKILFGRDDFQKLLDSVSGADTSSESP